MSAGSGRDVTVDGINVKEAASPKYGATASHAGLKSLAMLWARDQEMTIG